MPITDFDTAYYSSQRPDVLAAILNGTFAGTAEDHYNQYGWRELSDPNPQFDTSYYLATNPDVLAADVNPFQHYVTTGINEGLRPSGTVVTLTADAPQITELDELGDAGAKLLTYTLTLDHAPTDAIAINYHTETSGSATPGDDFYPAAGTVSFAAGQTVAVMSVTVLGDDIMEADETVDVTFFGASLVAPVTATGTIINDLDTARITVSVAGHASLSPNTAYDLIDTTANLSDADGDVLNGATDITATSPATVAQATIIQGASNSGATTYNLSDIARNLSEADADVLAEAGTIVVTDNEQPHLSGDQVISSSGQVRMDDIINKFTTPIVLDLSENADTIDLSQHNFSVTVNGLEGNDTIIGSLANDIIVGGEGADRINLSPGLDPVNVPLSGGSDTVVYSNDAEAGAAGTLIETRNDIVTNFTTGEDKIQLSGDFADNLVGATVPLMAPIAYGGGLDITGFLGQFSGFVIGSGGLLGLTSTRPDLFDLGDLNAAIGGITNEALGQERLLAFNSSDGNSALYKFTSANNSGLLEAAELQLLGTFDEALANTDFNFIA